MIPLKFKENRNKSKEKKRKTNSLKGGNKSYIEPSSEVRFELDIDCVLNNLEHQAIFETTKQQLISNIDTPISDKEISLKLKKINNIITESFNIPPLQSQTTITKGLFDSFQCVMNIFTAQWENEQSDQREIPHIIVYKQANSKFIQLLKQHERDKLIQLTVVDALELPNILKQRGPINSIKTHIIPNIQQNTKLIIYPLIDMSSGTILVDLSGLEAINQIKKQFDQICSFLDCTGSFHTLSVDLQQYPNLFSIDFWSIGGNQIHSTHKQGLLMFQQQHFQKITQNNPQLSVSKSQAVFYNEEVSAILNSLQVFLCNRQAKNERIIQLKNYLIQELLNKQLISQTQKPNKIIDLSSLQAQKGFQISPFIHQLAIPLTINSKQKTNTLDILQKELAKHNITVQFQNATDTLQPIQISFSDLTFQFVVKQFTKCLQNSLTK